MRLGIILLAVLGGCVTQPGPDETTETAAHSNGPVIVCDGIAFHAVMHEKQATLYLPGIALSLPRMPTESGTRYAANNYVLWQKPNGVIFNTPDKQFHHCGVQYRHNPWANAWLRGVDFRAVGNEPGWTLEMSDTRGIQLHWNGGKRELRDTLPAVSRDDELFSYRGGTADQPLLVDIMARPCRDSMKGDTHSHAVRVRTGGQTLLGCGRGRIPVPTND